MGLVKPIRYFGGKGNFVKEIHKEFPLSLSYDTYIEPFAGSYTVGMMYNFEKCREIYNDKEKNVYSLFKVLTNEELFNRFKTMADLFLYSEDLRSEYKETLKNNNEDLDIVTRAFKFFYVNRTSFNGVGGFTMDSTIRRGMSKAVSDTLSSIDGLYEVHQRLQRVIACNRDAMDLIEQFNKPNHFIYCDPPYVQSTRLSNARYDIEMSDDEHIRFIDACIKSNAKILISGYDNPIYDKLLDSGFTKKIIEDATMNVSNSNKKLNQEVVWKNY